MLKLISSRDGKLIGRQMDIPTAELRRRAGMLVLLRERIFSRENLIRLAWMQICLLLIGLTWICWTRFSRPRKHKHPLV